LDDLCVLAEAQVCDEEHLHSFLADAKDKLNSYNSQQLALVAQAMSKLSYYDPVLLQALDKNARLMMPFANPKSATMTAWALAKLDWHHADSFMELYIDTFGQKLNQLSASDLACCIWAMAKVLPLQHDANFVRTLVNNARHKLDDFSPSDLSLLLWAVAKLGYYEERFVRAVMREVPHKLDSSVLDSEDQDRISFAMVVFDGMASFIEARAMLKDYKPAALANMAMALAHQHEGKHPNEDSNPGLILALVEAVKQKLRFFGAQDMADTLWAIAKLGYTDRELLESFAYYASYQLDQFTPKDLANTAWALASHGFYNESFMSTFLSTAGRKLMEFQPHEAATLTWALSKLGTSAGTPPRLKA